MAPAFNSRPEVAIFGSTRKTASSYLRFEKTTPPPAPWDASVHERPLTESPEDSPIDDVAIARLIEEMESRPEGATHAG